MNATQWTVLGIIGLAVLGVIGLFVKEKIDAAKINMLELENSDMSIAAKVHNESDADLRADVEKRLESNSTGNPKT